MGGCRWRLSGHFLKNDIIQMKQTQLRIFIGQPFLPYAIERVEGLSCLHWSILQRWVNLFSLSQHLSHFRANLAAAHMFAVGEFHKAVKKKRKPSFISFLSPCSNSSAWPSKSFPIWLRPGFPIYFSPHPSSPQGLAQRWKLVFLLTQSHWVLPRLQTL